MPTATDHRHGYGRRGDWVEVRGIRGQAPKRGEILEVLGHDHHTHYRVRWDEQHESILYPSDGVIVRRSSRGER